MVNITNETITLNADQGDGRPFHILLYVIVFSMCSVVGTLGNSLVIVTLVIEKSLRKSQNLFIGSLALADLVVSCLTMPASITGVLLGENWFEEHHSACIFVSSLCSPSCTASLFGMAWVAISRYFYIARVDTYQKYFTTSHIVAYTACIWLLGVAVHLPNHLGWGTVHFSKILYVCTIDTELFSYKIFYALICLLSILISFTFYGKIYLKLRKTKLAKKMIMNEGNHIHSKNQQPNHLEEETKMIKATFKIFVLFFVCWGPVTVLLVADLGDAVPSWAYLYAGLLAHGNSTLNFFVYFLQNDNFTKSFKRMFERKNRVSNIRTTGTRNLVLK